MLFVLVQVEDELYGIEARQIVEVLPIVRWRKLPHAPAAVLGLINHHGKTVPLLDLTEFLGGRPSRQRLSTKIIVLDYYNNSGEVFHLALLIERILETFAIADEDFADSGVANPQAPYAGPVATTVKGIVQRLDLRRVLPPEVRDRLFSAVRDYATENA
jgi:chemotaxis-related protein WspB